MAYYYDRYGRRRRAGAPEMASAAGNKPTLEDYQSLVVAYHQQQTAVEELKATIERQKQELAEKNKAVEIKSEALSRQTSDMKQIEAELVWTKAALQQMQSAPKSDDGHHWEERYLRLQAEMENLRRRWEQRYEADSAEFRRKLLADMLPLADHLELAQQYAHAAGDQIPAEFVRNLEATQRAFLDTLKRYGVTTIDAVGQPFDPALHEAVGQVKDANVEAEHVARVLLNGYREGDRLVRPARVLVSQGNAGDEG